jgi:flagella synthesis protein FlgN
MSESSQPLPDLDLTQLSSHLDALNGLLDAFESVLEQEAALLKDHASEALHPILERKAQLAEQLDRQFQQLETLLPPASGHFADLVRNQAFARQAPKLQHQAETFLSRSQRCNDLNIANGISIQILNNINQVSIELMAGQTDNAPDLYGRSGQSKSSKSSSTLGKA